MPRKATGYVNPDHVAVEKAKAEHLAALQRRAATPAGPHRAAAEDAVTKAAAKHAAAVRKAIGR